MTPDSINVPQSPYRADGPSNFSLSTTVIGPAGTSEKVLIRKRCPSGDTLYCGNNAVDDCAAPYMWVQNRGIAAPGSMVELFEAARIGTAMRRPSAAR